MTGNPLYFSTILGRMAFLEKIFTLNLLVCVTYVFFVFPQAILWVQRAKSAADWHGTRDWHDTISWRYHIQHSGHYKGFSVHRNADQTTLDLPGNLDKEDIIIIWKEKLTHFLHSPPFLISLSHFPPRSPQTRLFHQCRKPGFPNHINSGSDLLFYIYFKFRTFSSFRNWWKKLNILDWFVSSILWLLCVLISLQNLPTFFKE